MVTDRLAISVMWVATRAMHFYPALSVFLRRDFHDRKEGDEREGSRQEYQRAFIECISCCVLLDFTRKSTHKPPGVPHWRICPPGP